MFISLPLCLSVCLSLCYFCFCLNFYLCILCMSYCVLVRAYICMCITPSALPLVLYPSTYITVRHCITDDLRTAEKKGNAAYVSFVEKRLKSNEIDYLYAPLSKSNLQTFGNLVNSMTVKSTATAVVVKADRGWFARMVVIAHHQQMHILEGKAQLVEDVPASAVWYMDGVAILHYMNDVPRAFRSLASYVFPLVKSAASQDRTRTDLIMDQYPDVSIKNPERERERRGTGGSIQIFINHGNQKCPTQWKKYLSDGSNKANIAYFPVQEWQKPEYFVRFAYFGSLFVTHGMECHKLTTGENGIDRNRVDELCAQQEEADTRILLHASHAAFNGHYCIALLDNQSHESHSSCCSRSYSNAADPRFARKSPSVSTASCQTKEREMPFSLCGCLANEAYNTNRTSTSALSITRKPLIEFVTNASSRCSRTSDWMRKTNGSSTISITSKRVPSSFQTA